jgi:hypothetical protein
VFHIVAKPTVFTLWVFAFLYQTAPCSSLKNVQMRKVWTQLPGFVSTDLFSEYAPYCSKWGWCVWTSLYGDQGRLTHKYFHIRDLNRLLLNFYYSFLYYYLTMNQATRHVSLRFKIPSSKSRDVDPLVKNIHWRKEEKIGTKHTYDINSSKI